MMGLGQPWGLAARKIFRITSSEEELQLGKGYDHKLGN
jgi:hypothetical protein